MKTFPSFLFITSLIMLLVSMAIPAAAPEAATKPIIIIINSPTPTRTPTPINLGNFVWDDLDKDGIQDNGEPGLAGVTVQLWNSAKTQMIDQEITNATGNYTLVAPVPGDYRIRVVLPSLQDGFSPKDQGADNSKDSDINSSGVDLGFSDIFNIADNVISIANLDAGIIKYRTPTPTRTPTPINIGNLVWDDLDKDGIQDAGEPGLAGITVQLWNSAKTVMIDQETTNATGNYTVIAPVPGDYRIRVVLPSLQDGFSPKDQGADDLKDSDINSSGIDLGFSDTFTLASNVISITMMDAGIIKYRTPTPTRTPTPINIGNFVWHDLNANGIQDSGEPGIPGVTIQLWNPEKTVLYSSAVTNANGTYTVVAPVPGSYRLRVIPFSGATFSPKDQGGDDQKDSDFYGNIYLSSFGFTDTFTLASNVISTTLYDVGFSVVGTPPTQTPTPTPTLTLTPTPTPTETNKLFDFNVYLPSIMNGN